MAVLRRVVLSTWCTLGIWLSWASVPLSAPPHGALPAPLLASDLVAVPIANGTATFDLPTGRAHDRYLVVTSALAAQPGPFPVEIRAEAVADPRPFAAEDRPVASRCIERLERRRRDAAWVRDAVGPPADAGHTVEPPAERSFWLMVRGDDFARRENYQNVVARRVAAGPACAVYVDRDDLARPGLDALVGETRETFEREVYPIARRTLGRHRDVDGDGRFTILFTHWLGQLSGGTVSVGGFVRGSDFYPDLEPPLGNRCDMMYLNADLQTGPHLRTLLAHEYAHAITFSEHVFGRYLPDAPHQEEESWLDESIAHLAENRFGYSWSNLDYRISGFLNAPERYRLVVEDYRAAELWRGHGNRGSTYLFLRWCVDQFGEDTLRSLVQSNLSGVTNVETALGCPFAELYRAWTAALFLSQTGMAREPSEELRFLSLRAQLGSRLLAGPSYEYLDPDGAARRFSLVGTSTKYWLACAASAAGMRVRVLADPAADLQVTVRRLPANLPRLVMHARLVPSSQPADTPRRFRVELSEADGVPANLEHLAWERLEPGSNKETDRGCSSGVLDAHDLREAFGRTRLEPDRPHVSAEFELDPGTPRDPSIVIKLAARDDAGHSVTAWCTLDLSRHAEPARIANAEGRTEKR